MKPNSIAQIYYDFRSAYDNTADTTIDFYNKNALILNNIKKFDDKEQLKFYIELTNKYIEALSGKKRFNQTVDHINDKLLLIDNEIDRLHAGELKDNWYFYILFIKGTASYHMRDYKISTQIFENLTKHDPGNEQYKDWLMHSKHRYKLWLLNLVLIISAIIILMEILFGRYVPHPIIKLVFLTVGLAGSIINLGYGFYLQRSYRKKTSK